MVGLKLKYVCSLLLSASESEVLKLRRVGWKCLRVALGAMISVHPLGLQHMADVMPLFESFRFNVNIVIYKFYLLRILPLYLSFTILYQSVHLTLFSKTWLES